MPLVNVLINGHAFTLACDEGEEEHLRELAQFFDKRVRELVSSVGQVGDSRLLLMGGLLVTDELAEALERVEQCEKEIAELREAANGGETMEAAEDRIADLLENTAAHVETIAARVARS